MSKTRAEVMADVVRIYQAAEKRGDNPDDAVREAYPGIPRSVISEAAVRISEQQRLDWWRSVGVETAAVDDLEDIPF